MLSPSNSRIAASLSSSSRASRCTGGTLPWESSFPDLIAYSQIIVDTKTVERITDHERGQMMNYLRITKLPLGLVINFKHRKLEWVRIALTQ